MTVVRKSYCLLLCALLWLPLSAADEPKATPAMPSEVTLTSGRVLRNVQVVRWEKDRVVLKHSAGANTIAFSLIKSLAREDLEAIRVAHEAKPKTPPPTRERTLAGQVFIVTNGQTNHTLGDLTVRLVPKEAMHSFLGRSLPSEYEKARKTTFYAFGGRQKRQLEDEAGRILYAHFDDAPQGVASAKTDAEGRFELRAPEAQEFCLYARGNRMVAGSLEWYVFVREVKAGEQVVNLSNSDLWAPEG